MREIEVPVLIVGAGGCGLTSSIILSALGIKTYLIERHPSTANLPKAHYLNQRSMEIMRSFGVADEIYHNGAPLENMSAVGWYTSLGGDGPLDRKTIHVMDAFGGGKLREVYTRDSPSRSANMPQMRLEPILQDRAEASSLGTLHFNHQLEAISEEGHSVVATVLDLESGERYRVRAQYIIGADGGRTLGPALGVKMEGPTALFDFTTTHFKADLSQLIDDDRPLIRMFINPDQGATLESGGLVAAGPHHYDRQSEEWVFHFAFSPNDPTRYDEASVVTRLRRLLKLPDGLPVEVLKISHWLVEGVLADRFREGRVFLAGDAAHRHPPTTGLGLNSAIQDSHNLAWKLAAVIKGEAAPTLLDSYQMERRPVAARNVHWALFTLQNHLVVDAGLGLIHGAPPEVNRQALELFIEDSDNGATRRARFLEVINSMRVEFQAHDLELGFVYDSDAVVGDGTTRPRPAPMGDVYVPTTRPGHRLPHAWLQQDGRRVSTHDLVRHGRFAVFTGPTGQSWIAEVEGLADKGWPVDVYAIGDGAEIEDPDGAWCSLRQISDAGAVLVRPDGHVGARFVDSMDAGTLEATLGRILGGKPQPPTTSDRPLRE